MLGITQKSSRRNKLCRIKLLTRIFGCAHFGSGCNAKWCALSQIILLPYTIQKTDLRVSSVSLKFQAFSCIKIVFCSHSSFGKCACELLNSISMGKATMWFLISSCMLPVMFWHQLYFCSSQKSICEKSMSRSLHAGNSRPLTVCQLQGTVLFQNLIAFKSEIHAITRSIKNKTVYNENENHLVHAVSHGYSKLQLFFLHIVLYFCIVFFYF